MDKLPSALLTLDSGQDRARSDAAFWVGMTSLTNR